MTQAQRKTLLIIGHTPSENTRRLMQSMEDAVTSLALTDIKLEVHSPFDVDAKRVQAADAIILFTTENFGYMSGALKDCFERIYYPCLEHTQGLPVALVIRAGNDGQGAQRSVQSIMTGLRWREAQPPLICKGAWQEAFIQQVCERAAFMAVALEAGML